MRGCISFLLSPWARRVKWNKTEDKTKKKQNAFGKKKNLLFWTVLNLTSPLSWPKGTYGNPKLQQFRVWLVRPNHNLLKLSIFHYIKSYIYHFLDVYFHEKKLRDPSITFGGIDGQRNLYSNWMRAFGPVASIFV